MSTPRPYGAQRECRKICRKRDRGICSSCNLDTLKVRMEFAGAYRSFKAKLIAEALKADPALSVRSLGRSKAILERARLAPTCVEIKFRTNLPWKALVRHRTLWEAHHLVAVSEGGSLMDPSNLATHCLCCHARETARQMRERAERKRRGEAVSASAGAACSPDLLRIAARPTPGPSSRAGSHA